MSINSVLVSILTYNEELNIKDCINSILNCGFENIIVLDGGSSDLTLSIVRSLEIEVIVKENSSISTRRDISLKKAVKENFKYLFFVDADQRLVDPETFFRINSVFNSNVKLAGIQLFISPEKNSILKNNYWEKGFYRRHFMIASNTANKKVIGTPCFFKIELVKRFSYENKITGPSDDTVFCKKIHDSNLNLITSDIRANEIVRSNFNSTIKKAFWYGIGDAQVIIYEKKLSKKLNHLYHVMFRNTIIYPLKNINSLFLFFSIFGLIRAIGFLYFYLLRPKTFIKSS